MISRCVRSFILVLLVLLFPFVAKSQQPFIDYYSPEEYSGGDTNFDITQDNHGFLYVANTEGIIIYDGKSWRLVPVNGRAARVVEYSEKYGVLVGTVNDFGWIKKDTNHSFYYESLAHLFPGFSHRLPTIFEILESQGKIFIETQKSFFVFDGKTVSAHPFDEYISHSFVIDSQLVVFGYEWIYTYQNGNFQKVRKAYDENNIDLFLLFKNANRKFTAVRANGTFIEFDSTLTGSYKQWNSKLDAFMIDKDPYLNFIANPESDRYFFPSYSDYVYVTDNKGNPISRLSKDEGIIGNAFYNAFKDREKNIWIASNNGLSKINYELPLQKFDAFNGLKKPLHSMAIVKDSIYIGTDNGIFLSADHGNSFHNIGYSSSQIWKLQSYEDGVLVASGNEGLVYLVGGKERFNFPTETAAMTFTVSQFDKSMIYIGLYSGAKIVQFTPNGFTLINDVNGISDDVRSIEEDVDKRVWFGTRYNGFYMIPNSESTSQHPFHYGMEKGLSLLEHNYVFGNSRNLWFTTRDSIYTYSSEKDRFYPLNNDLTSRIKAKYPNLFDDGQGNIWSFNDLLVLNKRNPSVSDSTSLLFFKNNLTQIIASGKDEYFILSKDALYRVKLPISISAKAGEIEINHVKQPGKPLYFPIRENGTNEYESQIDHNLETVEIELAYPSFIQEKQIRFRYALFYNGNVEDLEWSDWQKDPKIIISGLNYGTYTFYAEALNGIGKFSQRLTLSLERKRPWYYHPAMIFAYLLTFVLLIYAFIYWRNRQILKRNEYLEVLVQTRTDEVVKQNEELKYLASEMAKANQFKSNMLQMAVHDLRNPLAVLSGYCDLMQDDVTADQKKSVLSNMDRVLDKLLGSIDNLLTVNQKGHAENDRERTTLDFKKIVIDVVSENTILANKKKQTIQTNIDSNCLVVIDRYQMHEVLDNLVNNAIKYAPMDSTITVKLYRKKNIDGMKVLFSVTDKGPGLKLEDQIRIFTAYAKSENVPTGGEKSSGLGLSIVKEIVQWHDGRVWVESNPDKYKGSTFFVELPSAESIESK